MARQRIGAVAVVGGGIGAIQASLDLADSGYRVYLIEKNPSIGGVMAQLDKTFPTNDCSMCIMSPKLVEVGRHRNIELITMAEVGAVRGDPGRFEIDVHQRARYIDVDKCIACGQCAEKCPKRVDDVFNGRLIKRKAAYVQYPQAVPLKYAIDKDNCLFFLKGKCRACEKFCPAGAVRFDDQDRDFTLEAGSIILAAGYRAYDPSGVKYFGYDQSPDVMTSLEFERILSASGPTRGHLLRMSDHQEPRKIAWLQCVGSRDLHADSNPHCSSVCCMYAIKQAIIAKEHAPYDLDCAIFFMDMRTHGKGFEQCYNEARERHGVRFVRSRVHSIIPSSDGRRLVSYATEDGRLEEESFDLVVLSVGMETTPEARDLALDLGVNLTPGHFGLAPTFDPAASTRPGVYFCGAFAGPKDIPQTVIEAGAAALRAGADLADVRDTMTEAQPVHSEVSVVGDRPRIGVFVCHCGINISGVVDVPGLRDYAAGLPFVEYADDNLYSCSQDTQDAMSRIIREKGLNRIVVAACTPRTHEPLFQETLLNAGLNKYLFEMVNIRNQDSWVHKDWPEEATDKARDLIRMAVARVALQTPLKEEQLNIDQRGLVIGGGISGMAAAKALSGQGYEVHLLERTGKLGGNANFLHATARGNSVQKELAALVDSVESDPLITRHLGSELTAVDGFVGSFRSTISLDGKKTTIEHGVTIIATGAREHQPEEYLFGRDPRVITGLELDRRLNDGDPSLKDAGNTVFIQCVGSREPERPYCSRLCCTHSVAAALHLKELNPDMNVYVLYRDMRTYGEREALYLSARRKGVVFIRYDLERKPRIDAGPESLEVTITDHVLGVPVALKADLLVLASSIVAHKDEALARFFKVPMNEDGFFAEAHVKLGPSEFASDGVFLCGMAHYPKPIDESVAQAQAAASRAVTLLSRKTINTSGTVAHVDQARCTGCGVCVEVCPYSAPSLVQEGPLQGKAEINPVLCKGCGSCSSSCRSGAARLRGFEESQIMAMINAL
ncbi:MAG: FAD-dependent oxidoreductase [Proteobacteria bacterium]|nr:FAD-dependent oxidoreductase [Pseudomonadota bacterium]